MPDSSSSSALTFSKYHIKKGYCCYLSKRPRSLSVDKRRLVAQVNVGTQAKKIMRSCLFIFRCINFSQNRPSIEKKTFGKGQHPHCAFLTIIESGRKCRRCHRTAAACASQFSRRQAPRCDTRKTLRGKP